MGRLIYQERLAFDIEDRLLSHLRVVIMNKLRRSEPFMLQLPHPDHGNVSVWLHPSVPLILHFRSSRPPRIDPALIEHMMIGASSTDGLTLPRSLP